MTSSELKNARPQSEAIDRRSLNLPNLITVSRLVLSGVLFALISIGGWWVTATIVFSIAAATDAIDGYLARKYGQVTVLGRILDPFVDKIIICGSFVFLVERGSESGVNAWMALAILGREMFVTGLRSFLEQAGRDFSAVWSGKIKMALQCIAVAVTLVSLDARARIAELIYARNILLWLTVGITIYTGIEYAWRGFRMLRRESSSEG